MKMPITIIAADTLLSVPVNPITEMTAVNDRIVTGLVSVSRKVELIAAALDPPTDNP